MQEFNQRRLSRSCQFGNSSDQRDDGEDMLFHPSTYYTQCENRSLNYNTFRKYSGNAELIRNHSASLPYIPCDPTSTEESLTTLVLAKSADEIWNCQDSAIADSNSTTTPTTGETPKERFWGFSSRQFKCGIALSLLSIVDVMGFSIFAPFFPVVAERKNMSEAQIGLVFAAFSMAGIFASIVTGTLLVKVGARFVILSGLLWSAGATVCFGLLDRVPDESFFWLCLLCRVFMGIGSLSAFTALFAVIFQEFKDRSLTVIGLTESLCSLGGIVGPLIGGGLYDLGGYVLPFAFLGAVQMFVLGACAVLLPPVAVQSKANAVSPAWLLLNLHGLFSSLFVVASFMFQLSAFMVGVFMLIFSIFYGLSTPIWGYISESRKIGAHMMTLNCFIAGIVLLFFGPADFWMKVFGWGEPQKWLVIVCTIFLGITMGGLIMPTFGEMIVAAKQMKLQENELAQYGLVSGLWNTMFSIGDILGPTVGGVMTTQFHFNNTLAIFGAALMGLAIMKMVHLVHLHCKGETSSESEEDSTDNGSVDEREGLLRSDNSSLQA